MEKKKLIVSYDKSPPEVLEAIGKKYPHGFDEVMIRINTPNPFYAITVDTEDATYLVKIVAVVDEKGEEPEDIEIPEGDIEHDSENKK